MPFATLRLLWLRVRTRGRLRAARSARVGRDARVRVGPGGRISLGAGCAIGECCRLHVAPGAALAVGADAVLGDGCVLVAHRDVRVEAGARLGDRVALVDFDHVVADVEVPIRLQGLRAAPVRIGAGARVGHGAAVLRGVTVGDRATVREHAVVTAVVPASTTVGGVPARALPR